MPFKKYNMAIFSGGRKWTNKQNQTTTTYREKTILINYLDGKVRLYLERKFLNM